MKTFLMFVAVSLILIPLYSQVQHVNDSVTVIEDKVSFDTRLDSGQSYSLTIFMAGIYANDTIEICHNNKKVYSRILTKSEIEGTRRISPIRGDTQVQIKKYGSNDLVLFFNGVKIDIPFRGGYSMLHIGTWIKEVDKKYKVNYSFSYTNNLFRNI